MKTSIIEEITELLNSQNFQQAQNKIVIELKKNPENQQLWLYLASCLASQNHLLDALAIFEKYRLLNPLEHWVIEKIDTLKNYAHLSNERIIDLQELLNLKETTVSIAMIIKNEMEFLPKWYNSISGLVNEIVIVDTGSSDGSIDFLNKIPEIKLLHYKWDGSFSNARNFALPHITSDWVFWMDADEQLFDEDFQNESIQFLTNFFETYKPNTLVCSTHLNIINEQITEPSYDQIRLFSTNCGFSYVGKVHEQIHSDLICDKLVVRSGLRILHYGYEENIVVNRKKFERNVELLKQQIPEDNSNYYWSYIITRELRYLERYEEALTYANLSLTKIDNPSSDSKLAVLDEMAKIYTLLGDMNNLQQIALQLLDCNDQFPNGHYYYHYATLELSLATIQASFNQLDAVKTSFQTYAGHYLPDQTIFNWKLDFLKGSALRYTGHLAEARTVLQHVAQQSDYEQISNQLAFIEDQLNKLTT